MSNTTSTFQPVSMRQSRQARNKKIFLILLQIVMSLLLFTYLVPTLWMITTSLKSSIDVFNAKIIIPDPPQWVNYVKVFVDVPFGKYAWNTLLVTFFAVLGTVVSSMMVAYSFSRIQWPGRQFFFSMMLATMMLPDIVTLIPRFILFKELGWIDTFLPLIVPFWCAVNGLYVFLAVQFFRNIPRELEEAALIDGASRFQTLTQILLPLSKPVIATISVFALIQHYNEFLTPLIYLNSREKWVMSVGIRALNDTNVARWELVFAASTVMLVPVLLLFILAQRYFVQGIAMTGFGGR
jgi:multiple sugar transport system permease protein